MPFALDSAAQTKPTLADKLAEFRLELIDLAYALDREGRQDAADVALSVSARIGELCSQALTTEVHVPHC